MKCTRGPLKNGRYVCLLSGSEGMSDLGSAIKNREYRRRQPLEIDCSRGQIRLDLHVG